jgi:L-2-hydroxyglutarate oxidase LhgO
VIQQHFGAGRQRRWVQLTKGVGVMEKIDCAVIGAGVVGLAVARALARDGREVVVLERAAAIGTETSARSSEVIHAGIYYPAGSWKAQLCVTGNVVLYKYCEEHGISYRRCGKLIVATAEDEIDPLRSLQEKAIANGVEDLRYLDADAARNLEPELSCRAALLSPSTGIIDSHALMLGYRGDLEACGGVVALRADVQSGKIGEGRIILETGGSDGLRLSCTSVVNSAGFLAPDVAQKLDGFLQTAVPKGFLCKGSYYTFAGRSPFRHLIYPMPNEVALGVHLTFDLGGQVRFGPDVEWVEEVNYDVDPKRADLFYDAVGRYWSGLPAGALSPGYAGIRPRTVGPGGGAQDFEIQGPADHGVPGLVNLFAIESPGITASLAIGDVVAQLLAA